MTRESSLTCQSSCPPDNTSSEWDEWAKPRNKSSHGVSSSSIGTEVGIAVTELEPAKLDCCGVYLLTIEVCAGKCGGVQVNCGLHSLAREGGDGGLLIAGKVGEGAC
jgi:hypothetical protein